MNSARMKITWTAAVAVAIVVCSLLRTAPASASAPKTHKCTYLSQKNKIFGDCKAYLSQDAIKITFKNNKWINLARSPQWILTIASPEAKMYYNTTLADWKIKGMQAMNGVTTELSDVPTRTGKVAKIAGIQV
ncbi:MAG: hypothetical protein ACRD3W_24515, partial [Terriglobales bacterium]